MGPLHIDARGLKCPAPIVELARVAKTQTALHITIDVDDPAAAVDIPAWCRMRSHTHDRVENLDGFDRHYLTLRP